MDDGTHQTMRCDFDGLEIPKNEQIRYRKTVSEVSNAVKDATKPEYCRICGKQTTKLCYSHTIPQYCLREIAVEGKLYTVASLLGGNLLDSEVGLAKANIFKMICGKCDTEFFKMYETPEVPSIVFRTFVSQGPVPVAGASSVS